MSGFSVSPQAAYEKWSGTNGGATTRGDLAHTDAVCPSCGERACYYSLAGYRELSISGFCEPCFDYSFVPPSERERLDQWMTLVRENDD